MEAFVQSPWRESEDDVPDFVAFAERDRDGVAWVPLADAPWVALAEAPWVALADVDALFEDADEHPVSDATPVTPTARRTAALLKVG